jgi:hypothetical protein
MTGAQLGDCLKVLILVVWGAALLFDSNIVSVNCQVKTERAP